MPKTTVKFVIPGEPFGKLNQRPTMINGHASAYSPKQNNMYMDRIIQILNQEMIFDGDYIFPKGKPVSIMIVAYFKIPDGHYKYYKREQVSRYDTEGQLMLEGKIRPTKKPDADNISKVICDGISHQGRIWYDDSQVVMELIMKYYDSTPRVEVTIEEM
jgi:Holliday junction resolvase RusA-like endonuclease